MKRLHNMILPRHTVFGGTPVQPVLEMGGGIEIKLTEQI